MEGGAAGRLRYIDSTRSEDRQDIEGHLRGGIPVADVEALADYWAVCPELRATLFRPNRPGYLDLAVDKTTIKTSIYQHPQFAAFISGMNTHFAAWRDRSAVRLKTLHAGFHPKELIVELGESLLSHYADKALIDAYDIYQHLMDYWAETLQDDAYLIAADGWKATTYRVIETKKGKDGKAGKSVDKGWACDLLPKPLIVARFFAAEQAAIDQLGADLETTAAKRSELEEEYGGEDDVFAGFDKINAAAVKDRIREIGKDKTAADELAVLRQWLEQAGDEAGLKKRLKDAEVELDAMALAQYPKLTEAEIKTLAVDDKWLGALDAMVHGEMDRVSQALTRRVRELAERYEAPLPRMAKRVDELEVKVAEHLRKMGFAWI